ncbi:MAG: hypothetical protein PF689_12005 [Deltaproteobacteria bacterium]|jgi:hypothetical protein|nr:hypothetical protein [Deltaproteobacteria bacterium]
MKFFLIFFQLFTSNSFKPEITSFKSNKENNKKLFYQLLKQTPTARTKTAPGIFNAGSGYYVKNSPYMWYLDNGNLIFLQKQKGKYKLRSLFTEKTGLGLYRMPSFKSQRFGLTASGRIAILNGNNIDIYSTAGLLVNSLIIPIAANKFTGFFSTGSGEFLIWSNKIIASITEKGKIKWKHLLSAPMVSSRHYGFSKVILLHVSTGFLVARKWTDGKILWSRYLFNGSKKLTYVKIFNYNRYVLSNYKTIKVFKLDTNKLLSKVELPWPVQAIYAHPFKNGVFVKMKNSILGYVDFKTKNLKWYNNLGYKIGKEFIFYQGALVLSLETKHNILGVAFDYQGKIQWKTLLSPSKGKIKLLRNPAQGLMVLTKFKSIFIYPPSNPHLANKTP